MFGFRNSDGLARSQHKKPSHEVFQLADLSRPVALAKVLQRGWGEMGVGRWMAASWIADNLSMMIGMSSLRSRSGGMGMVTVDRR